MDDQDKEADQPVQTPEEKGITLTNKALATQTCFPISTSFTKILKSDKKNWETRRVIRSNH